MEHFIILGEGDSSPNIIEDSLADLSKGSTFHIYTYKTSDSGPCRVYDWLLDNKARYFAYHDGTAPKMLIESALQTVESDSPWTPVEEMVEFAKNNKATVLYLWDSKNEERSEDAVMTLIDMGIRVLDLTQGLTPFMIADDNKDVNDSVDSLTPPSRSEYEKMAISELRQHAVAQGVSNARELKQEQIISELVSEPKKEQATESATVVVIFSDGSAKTFKVTEEHAQNLLTELKY